VVGLDGVNIMTELFDSTAAKIVVATQRGDSINRVAKKIGTSYSWTHEWVEKLKDARIIGSTDSGLRVVDHEMRQRYVEMLAAVYRRNTVSQEDAYLIPHFAGMEFAFTKIDAAYVWTKGGFQIARSHDDYPVFIQVHDRDVERWIAFFEQFGVETTINDRPNADDVEGPVHYVLIPETEGFDVAWVDGNPVLPLAAAVEQMTATRPAYEPALEIIADEYDIDIDATHYSAEPTDRTVSDG